MGVSTTLKIAFYTKNKEFIKKHDLDGRADGYIYGLVNDGGATFSPENFGEFSDSEKEAMKVYFDAESLSVGEGYAEVRSNIQSPKELMKIWTKIRSKTIKTFNSKLKTYHDNLSKDFNNLIESTKHYNESINKKSWFGKTNKIEIPDFAPLMSEYNFDRLLFDLVWDIDNISQVLTILNVAKVEDVLVEITAADY